MLFDANLQIAGMEIVRAEDEGTLQLVLLLALALPAGQAMIPLPAGVLRVTLGKDVAIEKFTEGLQVANDLADPKPESDLVIASSLQGVDQAVDLNAKLKQQ